MNLGTFGGTRLVLHPTFWLIIAFVGFLGARAGLGTADVLAEIGFVLALFACVVLHEFGHVLSARRYGIRTESVTLYPIGGVARLERMPQRPSEELVIAVCGPLVNVAIAVPLGLFSLLVESAFLGRLALANALLVAFNLLPAFPMDGGRVLRAALAMRMPFSRATAIAAGIGKAMVVPFVFAGVVWNPLLLVIGAFVWLGATAEARAAQIGESLAGARVMQASMGQVLAVEPQDRLAHVAELILDSSQKDFPVARGGEVIGSLTQADLLRAIGREGPDGIVADIMGGSPPPVDAGAPMQEAFDLMQRTRAPFLPVTEDGELVGIVTLENVREFIELRQAMGGQVPIRFQRVTSDPEPAVLN